MRAWLLAPHKLALLRPIWTGPDNNRGGKLRGLLEGVLNGNADPNPAKWEALKVPAYKLELKRSEPEGHPDMPTTDVPAFVKRLDMTNVAPIVPSCS